MMRRSSAWRRDHFAALPGFEVDPLYDDFSTPCFDGEHTVIMGGRIFIVKSAGLSLLGSGVRAMRCPSVGISVRFALRTEKRLKAKGRSW